ncbi:hypothetical protein E1301_Tti005695 [Triplophysa tibetana]|uniref:Uncharacterized protein n=1 Tax=Triplophysa tibetana TaxID=1572043 RepID=A0A5A9NEM2_9TELE|nr:hypothetical protein E1301_Tti005695 [Triplophysa tibetana]
MWELGESVMVATVALGSALVVTLADMEVAHAATAHANTKATMATVVDSRGGSEGSGGSEGLEHLEGSEGSEQLEDSAGFEELEGSENLEGSKGSVGSPYKT